MILALLACAAASPPPPTAGPEFWDTWGDGRAEVDTYHLEQPRYGQVHLGSAVLIYVTEDFSYAERVKADPGQHPDHDVRKVLKLNAIRDFATGVYTYHVMTSSFLRVDAGDGQRALDPLKLTFSAQEWCGMVYDELIVNPARVARTLHTYFDADTRPPSSLRVPPDLVYGDAVPVLIRGLRGDWLAPGESRRLPYLPTAMSDRFAHRPPALTEVQVERVAGTRPLIDGAGTSWTVEEWVVTPDGGPTTRWSVEAAAPHRVVGWTSDDGEVALLRATERIPYWSMNKTDNLPDRARLRIP